MSITDVCLIKSESFQKSLSACFFRELTDGKNVFHRFMLSWTIGIGVFSLKGETIGNMFPICIFNDPLNMFSEPFALFRILAFAKLMCGAFQPKREPTRKANVNTEKRMFSSSLLSACNKLLFTDDVQVREKDWACNCVTDCSYRIVLYEIKNVFCQF